MTNDQLRTALHVLARHMQGDDTTDEQTSNEEGLRPMGYFTQRPKTTTQQRANNASDAPLTMRPVLLAPPAKKREAA